MSSPGAEQILRFREDGFLVVEKFIEPALARSVAERYAGLFRGEFETTVPPDEWRWAEGRDPADVTRMIWNGWKSEVHRLVPFRKRHRVQDALVA